ATPPWPARRAGAAICETTSRTAETNGSGSGSQNGTGDYALTATLEPTTTDALGPDVLDPLIQAALAEDVGDGDITTDAILPPEMTCRAKVVCKQDGVIAALPVVPPVIQLAGERLHFAPQ